MKRSGCESAMAWVMTVFPEPGAPVMTMRLAAIQLPALTLLSRHDMIGQRIARRIQRGDSFHRYAMQCPGVDQARLPNPLIGAQMGMSLAEVIVFLGDEQAMLQLWIVPVHDRDALGVEGEIGVIAVARDLQLLRVAG